MTADLTRRRVIMGGTLLATACAAQAMLPRTRIDFLGSDKLDALIPKRVGDWQFISKSGLVVPPADQLSDQLYSQLITRVYSSATELPIMFLVAQSGGQDGVLQVHRPEICYPAGGYELVDFRVEQLGVAGYRPIATRVFTAVSPSRTEQLLYWTRIGRELPTTWAEQRLAVAKANLRGDIPDAVLVRISTISQDPGALASVNRFAGALLASLTPKGRAVLIGPPSRGGG